MADLREALESAITEAETKETPEAPEAQETDLAAASAVDTPAESVSTPDAPEKAEGGTEDAAKPVESEAPKADAKPDDKAAPAEPSKPNRVDRAPQSWKGQAKGEWGQLPLHVRQEVQRREAEINRALQESAPARQFQQQFEKVVTPYMARIQAIGLEHPMQAVEHLLQADYALSTAPKAQRAALMAKYIKDYDIDVVELDNALVGAVAPQQANPQADIQQLVQQQLQQALAPLMQREQLQRQAQQEQINHTVETMALDPKYPYFDEVRLDMADLIDSRAKRGIDLSLEDAYSMAVRMNPEVNAQMAQQNTLQSANQQHQQAMRAKNAASSITGSPASGGSMTPVGDGSLRGALEAAFSGARV
jgi:hypothetical protein